jgi:hypothetical protein
MVRNRIAVSAAAMMLFTGSIARADATGLAAPGAFILSVDRLVPVFAYSAISEGSGTNSNSQKISSISLFGSPLGFLQSYYNAPRVGFDFRGPGGLTFGGDVYVFLMLASSASSAGGPSRDQDKLTVFGIAPRAGYVVPLSPSVYFWPRAGVSFTLLADSPPSGSITGSSTIQQFGVDLEGMFVASPVEHVGITFGPVIDIPMSGSASIGSGTNRSQDSSHFHFGLTAGLSVWFGGR